MKFLLLSTIAMLSSSLFAQAPIPTSQEIIAFSCLDIPLPDGDQDDSNTFDLHVFVDYQDGVDLLFNDVTTVEARLFMYNKMEPFESVVENGFTLNYSQESFAWSMTGKVTDQEAQVAVDVSIVSERMAEWLVSMTTLTFSFAGQSQTTAPFACTHVLVGKAIDAQSH